MLRPLQRSAAAASLLLSIATAGLAQPRTRADCEAAHPSAWGKVGKDVPWVPTFDAVILAMLSMAQVAPEDRVLDLGAGDGRIGIAAGDIFKESFGGADVVTMFLLPHLNLCVRHKLLALPPGTRVVSHQYSMGDWKPDQSVQVQGRDVHLWVVPPRVDGVWDFHDSQDAAFAVDLRQTFD